MSENTSNLITLHHRDVEGNMRKIVGSVEEVLPVISHQAYLKDVLSQEGIKTSEDPVFGLIIGGKTCDLEPPSLGGTVA